MTREKVLIVDDERKIVDLVQMYLEKDGYRVLAAYDGPQAIELTRREKPALVVLDLNLPGTPGLDVCRTIRRESTVPIVMLTARDQDTDKILGLELGADDYVTKPFSPRELIARVRAVLRRVQSESPQKERVEVGDLVIDLQRHEVSRGGQLIDATPTEFRLLEVMASEAGRVFTRLQLLDRARGESCEAYERTVDVHVKNLRQKLEPDPGNPRYVLTVHGVGYKFSDGAS